MKTEVIIDKKSFEIFFIIDKDLSVDEIRELQINTILNNEDIQQELYIFHKDFFGESLCKESLIEEILILMVENNFMFDYFYKEKIFL